MENVKTIAEKIISLFPQKHIVYSFCYGSGVFQQAVKASNPMIDIVLVVKNANSFHQDNLKSNKSHYSFLKYFGANPISKLQVNWGAKVYFNTLIPHDDVTFKYGVVSRDDFATDLLDWCFLYLAGRLHKPVLDLTKLADPELETAIRLNLCGAIHTALLTLPEYFSETELYRAIAKISYAGDFRMLFGEDRNKVDNIVIAQMPAFRRLYSSSLQSITEFVHVNGDQFHQDVSPGAKWHHLNNLPRTPQKLAVRFFNKQQGYRQDTEDVLRMISFDPDCSDIVCDCIRKIVWHSSVSQSAKGMLMAGIWKSIKYSGRKLYKMAKSLKR